MDYLISQIWLCLAIAAILGGIIGWLLRGGCQKKLLDIENSWQDRYMLIEDENNVLIHQVKDIKTLHLEKQTLLTQVKDQEQNHERITVERDGLSSRLSIMEKGVKAAKISLDENKSLLQKKETILDELVIKLEASEAQLASVSQDSNEKDIELDDVRTKLEDYKTRWESGSTIQSKLESDLDEMEVRLFKSESSLIKAQDSLSHSKFEMDNQTLKMNKLLDVDTQMGTISTELSDAQSKIFQIESERDDTRAKLADSEMKFKDHSVTLKQLQDAELKLVSTEKKLHKVTEKSNNLSSKYTQSESKLDSYKADLLDAGSKIAVIQGMLSKSKDSSSSIGQSLDDKTDELKRLSIELSESEFKLSRITSKLSDTEVILQRKESEIDGYTIRLSEVEDSLIDSRKEQKTNAFKINNLLSTESKVETVSSELSDTQMKLKEAQSRLSDAKLKITNLSDDLSEKEYNLKAERDELLKQLTKSKEKLEATENNNSIQMVEYKKQLSELQVSLDKIDSNKDSKEKLELELKTKLKQLQQGLTDSEEKISNLTKNLSDAKDKQNSDAAEVSSYKKSYVKQLSELQASLDMTRNSSKDLRKESEEKLKASQSKLENSESQIKQLTTALSDTETELKTATTQTDDYKKQLSDVETTNDSKEEIEKQMKQLENELADSESSVSKLTTKLSGFEEKLEAKLQAGLEKKLNDNTVETEGYKKKISDLQASLDSSNQKNKQLETLNENLTEAESNLGRLKANLADAETDLKKKDSQVDSYKTQLKGLKSQSTLDKKPKIQKSLSAVTESVSANSLAETLEIPELDTQDEYHIEEIEGIGKGYGKQLNKFGITTTTEMLDKGSTVSEIKSIAKDMGKQEWVVRSWSSMADLTRIKGVSGQFAELIEFSGVHSVQSLKQQDAKQFTTTMKQVNDKEHRVKKAPDANAVKQWIGHAKTLPSVLDDDLEKIIQPSETSNTSSTAPSKLSDSEFSYEIEEIEGIGKGYAKLLNKLGIKTTTDLLAKGSSVSGVVSIAKDMDKQKWVVRSWSSMADLTRVEGVDGQFAELIEFSGVHSVQRLSQQGAKSFTITMKQVNDREHRVKEAPDTNTVSGWIKYAKTLSPVLDDSLEKIVKSSNLPSNLPAEDESAKTVLKKASSSNYSHSNYIDSSYEIEEIEGIGKGYGKQLSKIGISTTADLLKKYQADSSLSSVVEAMKQEKWVVQSWVSMADLLRIDGVDGQFAELLYFSGIHSVQQLALFNPNNLTRKMERTNEEQHRVKITPNVNAVLKWISVAKTLNKVVGF